MAGESPDRSEQQESSGETAAKGRSVPDGHSGGGSGGGSGTGDAPGGAVDPRMAFLAAPARPAAAADPERPARGGEVDQPTAVFAIKDGTSASRSGDNAPDPAEAAGGAEDAGAGKPGAGAAGDEAVTADDAEEPAVTAPAADADTAAGADRTDDAEQDGEPSPAAGADEGARGDGGTAAAEAPEKPGSDPQSAAGGPAEETGEDARLRAAVAAWISGGDDDPDGTPGDDAPQQTPDTDTDADADADATGSTTKNTDSSEDTTKTDEDAPADEESGTADKDHGTTLLRAPTAPATDAGAEDAADSEAAEAADKPTADPETRDRTDADGHKTEDAETAGYTDEESGATGKDRGTTLLRALAVPATDDTDAESGDRADADGHETEDAEEPGEADRTGDADEEPGTAGKDRGTTLLRAQTVPADDADAEAADKPTAGADRGEDAEQTSDADEGKDRGTTLLRALADAEAPGEGGKADDDADDEGGPRSTGGGVSVVKPPNAAPPAAPDGDADAERSSTFVPLRSSDGPPPPPPPPGPPPAAETGGETGAETGLSEPERTRQQALPPVPGQRPIDLLAELTNKPAPPETPMRTLVRRVKIWTPLVAVLVLLLIGAQLLRPLPAPELRLTAAATHTFEGDKPAIAWPTAGQAALEVDGLGSLGTSGEQEPVPIASVAKTMTAYLLLRDHPVKPGTEGKKIKVDKQAEEDAGLSAQGESTVEVQEGEELTQQEALNAIMIASANNVARLVARWDAGSEKAFVEKMNRTADELGMANTTYTDPSGLRKETVSTAVDQVKLGKAAMKLEAFRNSVKLPSYVDRNEKKQDNWNRLVPLFGTVGIKTGTTTAAGGNLLFAAEKEIGGTKQLIIGAVLSQHTPPIIDSVLAAGKDLIVSAQEALESETIIEKGTVVGVVDDRLGTTTRLVATKDVTAVGWAGLKVSLDVTEGSGGVPAEAPAGTEVGTLTVGRGPGQVKVPVALESALTEPGTGARLTRVL